MPGTLYSTKVTAPGGRHGSIRSDDGLLDLKLALPRTLGGKGDATNPEQLFAGDRWGPRWDGPTRRINNLEPSGPHQHTQNQLEVLAGASSWAFKSPLRTRVYKQSTGPISADRPPVFHGCNDFCNGRK